MSCKIKPRHVVTILEVSGRLCPAESGSVLTQAVHRALDDGALNLILDLRHVTYMDSTGVGELMDLAKAVTRRHSGFKLLHPNPRVEDLLQITGLASTLHIYSDENEAAFTFLQPSS